MLEGKIADGDWTAGQLCYMYNSAPEGPDEEQVRREAIAHWTIPIDGTTPVELYEFIDGSMLAIPEASPAFGFVPETVS